MDLTEVRHANASTNHFKILSADGLKQWRGPLGVNEKKLNSGTDRKLKRAVINQKVRGK
jgi:hypothetical protein